MNILAITTDCFLAVGTLSHPQRKSPSCWVFQLVIA
uniref:Uncharacterized protein n=1 Tax=Rhizophora mucronata TaxID=61149 RepID=A0A2P2II00_RHIMU